MGKFHPVSHQELLARLQRLGFDGPYAGGRNPTMVRGNLRLTVPNVHGVDIGVDLLTRILKQAGITREEGEPSK